MKTGFWIVALAGILAVAWPGRAQTLLHLRGHVRDVSGVPVEGATVSADSLSANDVSGSDSVVSGADGTFDLGYRPTSARLTVRAWKATMESATVQLSGTTSHDGVDLVLHSSAVAEQITVTATRSSVSIGSTANTIYALSAQDLQNYPALTLDQRLGQLPSFALFRRASSLIANPTSLGVSLRGLGSTAASRSLVIADGIPMNDAFGAWVHWNEVPALAIEGVTVATGGGSDLYGSSALGGVLDLAPAHAAASDVLAAHTEVSASGGSENTSSVNIRGDVASRHWSELVAGDALRTAGYIPTAPGLAGPVDQPANVHDQVLRSETDRIFSRNNRLFLVGNMMNEARSNGTRLQSNGTRLWRYYAGDDWATGSHTTGRVRLFGSDEGYRQTFSSINSARTTEALSTFQHVGTQELGASADVSIALTQVAFVTGGDARDIRATDNETPISTTTGKATGIQDTSARQRFAGGFGEALATHGGWSIALSLRVDYAANLSTRQLLQTFATQPTPTTSYIADRSEWIPSPRLGVVRQLGHLASLHASAFRAFRTPSMNELYRTGQVGADKTLANAQLVSERGTGWEAGATIAPYSKLTVNATYFWTEINRPVAVVNQAVNLEMRQNLGQIRSQGTEIHAQWVPSRFFTVTTAYQYANAVITKYSPPTNLPQQQLVGKWIPEVPRESFTAQLNAHQARIGEVTLALRTNGQAFDDTVNTPSNVLHAFATLDLSGRRNFGPHWGTFVNLQNLVNQRADVSRTTVLTLGPPFIATAGVDFRWGVTPVSR
jgi:outer membrane receptor protein involved in Fe transport